MTSNQLDPMSAAGQLVRLLMLICACAVAGGCVPSPPPGQTVQCGYVVEETAPADVQVLVGSKRSFALC